jgi:hypothetical protein
LAICSAAIQSVAVLLPPTLRHLAWLHAFAAFALAFSQGARSANARHTNRQPRLRAVLARTMKALLHLIQCWGTLEGRALASALTCFVRTATASRPLIGKEG